MKTSAVLAALAVTFTTLAAEPPAPKFRAQDVDTAISIGYGIAIADVDGDGKPDILLADQKTIQWYHNPDWKKHVIAENLTPRDNVCIAAQDIDGDGKCEVAVGGDWAPADTTNSGAVFYLIAPADRTQKWEPVKLHHLHFYGTQQAEMRDWYVKVFGATAATSANPNFITANLPGVGLNFSVSATPTAPTAGRVVDHIGFEVKNLQQFLAKLEAQGIKPSVAYRRVDALGINIAFIVDPWGTNIELTEGLDKLQ